MHIVPHNNIVKTYNNTHVHLRTNQQSNTTPVKKTTMSIVPSECKVGDNIWTVNHYQVTSIRDGWYSLRAEDGSVIGGESGVLEKAFHSVSKYTREERYRRRQSPTRYDMRATLISKSRFTRNWTKGCWGKSCTTPSKTMSLGKTRGNDSDGSRKLCWERSGSCKPACTAWTTLPTKKRWGEYPCTTWKRKDVA